MEVHYFLNVLLIIPVRVQYCIRRTNNRIIVPVNCVLYKLLYETLTKLAGSNVAFKALLLVKGGQSVKFSMLVSDDQTQFAKHICINSFEI